LLLLLSTGKQQSTSKCKSHASVWCPHNHTGKVFIFFFGQSHATLENPVSSGTGNKIKSPFAAFYYKFDSTTYNSPAGIIWSTLVTIITTALRDVPGTTGSDPMAYQDHVSTDSQKKTNQKTGSCPENNRLKGV
jgi:hypothetical protein